MSGADAFWTGLATLTYGCGAAACLGASAWLLGRRDRFGRAGRAMVFAVLVTAIWAMVEAIAGLESIPAALAESVLNLSWLWVVYRLFETDGRHASVQPIRPMVVVLALVELLQPAFAVLVLTFPQGSSGHALSFHVSTLFHLLVAVGGLVLVHNLYLGAAPRAQLALRWPLIALAGMWTFDLNYFTIAYLSGAPPLGLAALRGGVALLVAALLVTGAGRGSEELRFSPSRSIAFQSVSLLLIGAYLVAMVAVAQWLSYAGGDLAMLFQLAFVIGASVLALLLLPSRRLRGWLRVTVLKHLFQHRYDYRLEWQRLTRTLSLGEGENASLQERIVKAVGDITDSAAGLLLVPGEHGELMLGARWQWPTADVPAQALSAQSIRFFEDRGFIVELDNLRAGKCEYGEAVHVPEWLSNESRAWAMVPLLHFDRLVGLVVLARPPHARRLDWEDFDLLRAAGHQLASYLAEHTGQEALAEAGRFDDFNRRIAFVMHDIKNLASQLSLLARNAEHHAGNPEFQADMLLTLRNSADKLNALLSRLSRYGAGRVESSVPVAADQVAKDVLRRFKAQHQIALSRCDPCLVSAQREPLEQALVHLVQNAIDASAADTPVFISVSSDGLHGLIEVVDSGCGMSAEFVRTRLFKPFVSSKQGGFGIGAYETRELIGAMQGRLDVESREGLGTRFTIQLPLVAAADLYKTLDHKKVA